MARPKRHPAGGQGPAQEPGNAVKPLRFTNVQAPNQDFIIQALAEHVALRLGMPTETVVDIRWQERESFLLKGQVDLGWVCGLTYVRQADRLRTGIELLAAPVMDDPRYQNRSVYYSDVIVRRASHFRRFEDLRGSRWAFNEPHSHSGYNITRYHLAQIGEPKGFFKSALQAGSHQRCIALVLQSAADAAAIDSTVLEIELRANPMLASQLRVIHSMGPSPIPPLVARVGMERDVRAAVLDLLLDVHRDPEAQEFLRRGGIRRFVEVTDQDYDPIRDMALRAKGVQLI
jgi:phosphonate transport system substrate-binding protein